MTIFLAQHVRHVTGLELNPRNHEASCQINRRTNAELRLGSVFDHDLNQRYDAVVSLDVIEHLPVDEGRKFVTRLAQVCKPHGMVIIGTPASIPTHTRENTARRPMSSAMTRLNWWR